MLCIRVTHCLNPEEDQECLKKCTCEVFWSNLKKTPRYPVHEWHNIF